MGLLTKEQIKKSKDFKTEKVMIPEWGDEDSFVFVKTLSAHEKDSLDNMLFSFNTETGEMERNSQDFRSKWAVQTVCDENGNPLFTPEDIEWLRTKSSKPLMRIFSTAQRLNNVTKEEMEEITKN